ncbi:MAG TPA: hypothetical protein VLB27_12215, partial [candidate division Zixibacteria bacterium]|nr:hypothetical protein [candidate division Zixibacteria bacterium]
MDINPRKWRRRRTRQPGDSGTQTHLAQRPGRSGRWSTKPRSKRSDPWDAEWSYIAGTMTERTLAIRLHRFLRDNIPLLKSVIWTWTRLAAAPQRFEFVGDPAKATIQRARAVLAALDRRIYPDRVVRHGGFDALLVQYFDALFTDGGVAGELTVLPSHKGLDRFTFIDTATLEFEQGSTGQWRLFQKQGDKRIALDSDAVYYQPLDADAGRPVGKSLLSAVGFVARVEQELVRDMHKAMRNAGYQRLHVRIRPPIPGPAESTQDYTARANQYFEDTLRSLRDFDVDDNPVTWDDVEIAHVGQVSQASSSRNWYLNHRAMIEDVAAGCGL